jgi:hypothetical protein
MPMTRSPLPALGWRSAAALLATLEAAGCAQPGPTLHEVQVSVTSDGTSPVAGAAIRVRGDLVGTSNALGRATLSVPGKAGESLPVALTCPDDYRAPPGEPPLQLPADGAPEAARALTLALTCEVPLREAVVLVHAAGGANPLPVKVDGVRVGQTDALGFAHVHVRAAQNSEFEVSLDTSADERLSPVSPAQRFRLERQDELFVLDATLVEAKSPLRSRRAKRRPRAPKPSPLG